MRAMSTRIMALRITNQVGLNLIREPDLTLRIQPIRAGHQNHPEVGKTE